jgi:hypothetical protein
MIGHIIALYCELSSSGTYRKRVSSISVETVIGIDSRTVEGLEVEHSRGDVALQIARLGLGSHSALEAKASALMA